MSHLISEKQTDTESVPSGRVMGKQMILPESCSMVRLYGAPLNIVTGVKNVIVDENAKIEDGSICICEIRSGEDQGEYVGRIKRAKDLVIIDNLCPPDPPKTFAEKSENVHLKKIVAMLIS